MLSAAMLPDSDATMLPLRVALIDMLRDRDIVNDRDMLMLRLRLKNRDTRRLKL